MKKALLSLVCLLTLNAQAGISIGLPPGMSFPDFEAIEESQRAFEETIEDMMASDEVKAIVETVEDDYLAACIAQPQKASASLFSVYLRYNCEGATDVKLVITAKIKKGVVKVKNYKVKF